MSNKQDSKQVSEESLKKGQGYNNARGEVSDKKDTPKHNGQNLNNDPAQRIKRPNRKKKQRTA